MEVLPVALKKKEPEFPQLLELRTRKNFYSLRGGHKASSNNIASKPQESKNNGQHFNIQGDRFDQYESPDEVITDPFKPTYDDLQNAFSFLTENKYVIEAIFENVLLENNLYKFPLSTISDTEKKQLMEKLLSNDEFKEYVYQKIIRGQDNLHDQSSEGQKAEHQMSQALTQADPKNSSLVNSSIINHKESSK
jgi:hypothetical protein